MLSILYYSGFMLGKGHIWCYIDVDVRPLGFFAWLADWLMGAQENPKLSSVRPFQRNFHGAPGHMVAGTSNPKIVGSSPTWGSGLGRKRL